LQNDTGCGKGGEKVDLKGKTAIVTGGARGIGRAISLKLGSMGANRRRFAQSNGRRGSVLKGNRER
jgi:short-subunit dehydrogenase involved in D-alanine esterification of teichoic acids